MRGLRLGALSVLTIAALAQAHAQAAVPAEQPTGGPMRDCPAPGSAVMRNQRIRVRFEGETSAGVCLQVVGGLQQSAWLGIWPESWPEAAEAGAAARRVLAAPPGSSESFSVSYDWIGTSFASNVRWRFTVTNLGPGHVTIDGRSWPTMRLGWDEMCLGRPYRAHAEFVKETETGIVIAQSFRVELGSATTATDFWARYGGGLQATPDFEVTSMR